MNTSTVVVTLIAAVAAVPVVHAQQLAAPAGTPTPIADWMVPIHTQPSDPAGGAYGVWAAGSDYKVSFDDGFAFYPVLGETYADNLPLRWRTESMRRGEYTALDGRTTASRWMSDWRYELRYPGGVTEAYDVLEQGVEQTFVLGGPLGGTGDLVITGRLQTDLRFGDVAPSHQSLRFRDDRGNEIVSYGAAFAYDASGRRTDLATGLAGQRVTLRVPGAWLADATYPVTIDPMVGNERIPPNGTPNNGVPSYPNVSRDDVNNHVVVSYSRASSGGDYDTWVRPLDDNLRSLGLFFSDITASWSTRHTSPAYVRGASRWAIAIGRDFASHSAVRVYVHDAGNMTPNSGGTMFLDPPLGSSYQFPSIGGNEEIALNGGAYLVFQHDVGGALANTPNSEAMGVTVNVLSLSFGTVNNLHNTSGSFDNEHPMITHSRGLPGGSWVVVWQSYNYANSNDDWDAIGQRITSTGGLAGLATFGPSGTASKHKLHPVVDGRGGRFMLSFLMRGNSNASSSLTGNELAVQRFDWSSSSSSPTKGPVEILDSSGSSNLIRASLSNRSIAYDTNTDSHWAVVYRTTSNVVKAIRCGHTGLAVETATVYSPPLGSAGISPAVCYNDDDYEFAIVYGTNEAPENPLYGERLQYFSTAGNFSYGSSCAGTIAADNRGPDDSPFAGSEFYSVNLVQGRLKAPTWLLLGARPATLPLPLSRRGCELALDPAFPVIAVAAGTSDSAGGFQFTLPLPGTVTSATLFWQYIQLDLGALWSTGGLQSSIR